MWIGAVRTVDVEVDQRCRRAGIAGRGFDDLEDCAGIGCPPCVGCSEQVSVGVGEKAIGDEAAKRLLAVRKVEVDQSGRRVGIAVRGLDYLEDRAGIGCRLELSRRGFHWRRRKGSHMGFGRSHYRS